MTRRIRHLAVAWGDAEAASRRESFVIGLLLMLLLLGAGIDGVGQ